MKQVIRKFRQFYIFNIVIRYILQFINKIGLKSQSFAQSHWLISGKVKINLPNNKSLLIYSNADDYIPSQVYWKGFEAYEYAASPFFYLAEKSNTTIDIGANIGYYSILSAAANPKSKIFSFEPVERVAKRFQIQKDINNFSNIKIEQMIVGDSNDKQKFYIPKTNEMSLASSTKKGWVTNVEEVDIQSTTLDYYKEKNKLDKIDLIKMDCEFHEIEALNGMKNILKSDKPIILMEVLFPTADGIKDHFENEQYIEIETLMNSNNYYFYLITKDALIRVDKLEYNKLDRNYIFSTKKSSSQFFSHKDIAEIL